MTSATVEVVPVTSLLKPYVARMGLTPMLTVVTGGFLSLAVAGIVDLVALELYTDSAALLFFVAGIALLGGWGLFFLVEGVRHRVALAVGADGITLGRPIGPIGYHGMWWRVPVVAVPWQDIEAVVLFPMTIETSGGRSWPELCIGVRLRSGALLPLSEPKRGLWMRLNAWLSSDPLPRDIALFRRTMGWRLDKDALARTVAAFAPEVHVVERINGRDHAISADTP